MDICTGQMKEFRWIGGAAWDAEELMGGGVLVNIYSPH